jgi:hypothetical protein
MHIPSLRAGIRHSASGIRSWVLGLALLAAAGPVQAADRLLVMPLENVRRESSIYWLSEASAILLAEDLTALGSTALTRTERVRAFEELHLPFPRRSAAPRSSRSASSPAPRRSSSAQSSATTRI